MKIVKFMFEYIAVLTPCLVFMAMIDYTAWASWWYR